MLHHDLSLDLGRGCLSGQLPSKTPAPIDAKNAAMCIDSSQWQDVYRNISNAGEEATLAIEFITDCASFREAPSRN